jgi:mannosyltransferase OCH1-like enzyme
MTIPKIIHYVWVGPKAVPDADLKRIEHWHTLLPDWEIRFWNNDNVDFSAPYLRQAYAARAWNRVSDYTRMDSLTRFGGVYLDTDVDLHRSLDPLREHAAFLGFQAGDELPEELVNGAVFGAEKGHWLPSTIRKIFNEQYDGRTDIGSFAGPGMITKILREHGLERYSDEPVTVKDVTLYPKRFFYPYSWLETYSPDIVTPETYAVHRWAETWVVKKPSFSMRLRRAWIKRVARYAPSVALWTARATARRGS